MKNKYIILVVLCGCTAIYAGIGNAIELNQLQNSDDWYLDFNSAQFYTENYNSNLNVTNDYSNAYNFSASLGYNPHTINGLLANTRIATELTFSNAEKAEIYGVMANTFYDFTNNSNNLHGFLGLGAGFANLTGQSNPINTEVFESYTLPAYQASAGVLYHPESSPNTSMHLDYRYFTTLNNVIVKNLESVSGKILSNNIQARIKVNF